MPSRVVLKMVNRRLAELTRQYTAIRKGDPRALAIAEELSQIGTVPKDTGKAWVLRPTAKELALRESDR